MQVPENISVLIEKYLSGTINTEEKAVLSEWYRSFDEAQVVFSVNESEEQVSYRVLNRIHTTIAQGKKKEAGWSSFTKKFAVAASLLLLFSIAAFFIFSPNSVKQVALKNEAPQVPANNDVAPGGNKAILTLADGSTIVLDSATNGTIGQQSNIKIQKLANGSIVYNVNGKDINEHDEAFFNTIATPRGGQYHVALSDGTDVWLNAASSIRFPVIFTGTERKVEITGEAYFEVAKNKNLPFKVKAGTSEIEVLGTHFNVNTYNDEPTLKTTLLEGLVKVSAPLSISNQPPKFLQPGQQAVVGRAGKIEVNDRVDMEEVMAWKNGGFHFKSADLKTILRQVARWYDVDIEYKDNVDLHFTGQLTRNENISKVLEKLALTEEVNFKIDGKKIIVTR